MSELLSPILVQSGLLNEINENFAIPLKIQNIGYVFFNVLIPLIVLLIVAIVIKIKMETNDK